MEIRSHCLAGGCAPCGKNLSAQSLAKEEGEYFDCERPVVADMTTDPDLFFKSRKKPLIVLDEIPQLKYPSRLLKIGADYYPHLRLLATGSSTLSAGARFRDTLTGRKLIVHLPPVLWSELPLFHQSLEDRLFRGGLLPAMLAGEKQVGWYREWMDSFLARDIQRLFKFRDIDRFQLFFDYVLRQSAGVFEISQASRDLGISRRTVESHLLALQATHAVTLLRPYHGGGHAEIVRRPKVYAFDTGFVSFARSWDPLRPDDHGPLWEHVVREYLQAMNSDVPLCYWRDAGGLEVDFVIVKSRDRIDAIECKWNADAFDPLSLAAFRALYPRGDNYLVVPSAEMPYLRQFKGLTVQVCAPSALSGLRVQGNAPNFRTPDT